MQRLDLLMIVARRDVLRRLHGFLGFQCEFVEADHYDFASRSKIHRLKSVLRKTVGAGFQPAPVLSRHAAPPAYFPLFAALTVTFTWRGLDSSRFGRVTVSTPFLYSAPMASAFTVFGSEKPPLNVPYVRSTRRKFSSETDFSNLRSPRIVSKLFSTRTSMSFSFTSGKSALTTNSFVVS